MQADPLDAPHAQRSEGPFVLEPAELALDRATAAVELYAALRLAWDQRVQALRRMLVNECATASAEQIHESALLLAANLLPFCDLYRQWIKRGFSTKP